MNTTGANENSSDKAGMKEILEEPLYKIVDSFGSIGSANWAVNFAGLRYVEGAQNVFKSINPDQLSEDSRPLYEAAQKIVDIGTGDMPISPKDKLAKIAGVAHEALGIEMDLELRKHIRSINNYLESERTAALVNEFSSSKVLDWMDGKRLLTVYHGSDEGFDVFDASKIGSKHGAPSAYLGFSFASDEDEARQYGENILCARLNIKNPYYMTWKEYEPFEAVPKDDPLLSEIIEKAKTFQGSLERAGYDGIHIEGLDYWFAFHPEQIWLEPNFELDLTHTLDVDGQAVSTTTGNRWIDPKPAQKLAISETDTEVPLDSKNNLVVTESNAEVAKAAFNRSSTERTRDGAGLRRAAAALGRGPIEHSRSVGQEQDDVGYKQYGAIFEIDNEPGQHGLCAKIGWKVVDPRNFFVDIYLKHTEINNITHEPYEGKHHIWGSGDNEEEPITTVEEVEEILAKYKISLPERLRDYFTTELNSVYCQFLDEALKKGAILGDVCLHPENRKLMVVEILNASGLDKTFLVNADGEVLATPDSFGVVDAALKPLNDALLFGHKVTTIPLETAMDIRTKIEEHKTASEIKNEEPARGPVIVMEM
jgi:ADP-ribosyltransferase-like protein